MRVTLFGVVLAAGGLVTFPDTAAAQMPFDTTIGSGSRGGAFRSYSGGYSPGYSYAVPSYGYGTPNVTPGTGVIQTPGATTIYGGSYYAPQTYYPYGGTYYSPGYAVYPTYGRSYRRW